MNLFFLSNLRWILGLFEYEIHTVISHLVIVMTSKTPTSHGGAYNEHKCRHYSVLNNDCFEVIKFPYPNVRKICADMRCTLYEFSIFILSWKIIITNNYVNFNTDGNVILNVSKIDVRVNRVRCTPTFHYSTV